VTFTRILVAVSVLVGAARGRVCRTAVRDLTSLDNLSGGGSRNGSRSRRRCDESHEWENNSDGDWDDLHDQKSFWCKDVKLINVVVGMNLYLWSRRMPYLYLSITVTILDGGRLSHGLVSRPKCCTTSFWMSARSSCRQLGSTNSGAPDRHWMLHINSNYQSGVDGLEPTTSGSSVERLADSSLTGLESGGLFTIDSWGMQVVQNGHYEPRAVGEKVMIPCGWPLAASRSSDCGVPRLVKIHQGSTSHVHPDSKIQDSHTDLQELYLRLTSAIKHVSLLCPN
jgi:hypothetical protein